MIARDLGRTRQELLTTISAHELTWWKGLYTVEGEERAEAAAKAEREQSRRQRR